MAIHSPEDRLWWKEPLAKSEISSYDEVQEQDYKLVRRGSNTYLIRTIQ